ncbi:cytochrome P450 52A12 [Polyplosphaeria fusca]|uniref:Cytochrome P450 52A12 n=1 Tax=Polyplosphaeria fusca TaxID=682080 RepID=A0A9P4V728_9PLEO|nr:cytochrome P450 52A12 [Polyplosphaeria fusca]
MHSSILLGLWALCAGILYKVITTVASERRHRKKERQLGCKRPVELKSWDGFGIEIVRNILKADKECRLPQHLKERTDAAIAAAGRPVTTFSQNLLGNTEIFTIDPKNVQAVLATQFKDFGLGHVRNNNFYPLLGYGIFSSDGKLWEHSRALLRPQFAREQVSDLDLEERHVQDMMRLFDVGKDGWTNVIDIQPLFFRLTIDSATEFLFGESVDSQLSMGIPDYRSSRAPMEVDEKAFAFAFDKAQAQIAKAARFGDLYWMVHNKDFKEHCRKCHVFIDHYVNIALTKREKAATSSSGKPKYVFLDALAETTQDPVELRTHLISILLAGRDTTASLLSFLFMMFCQKPKVYKKLRSIIIEEFGTYENPREITFSKLKSCNYLQWCLNEILRIFPVVPFDGRRALVDTTLPHGGGPDGKDPIYIREGTQIGYSVYVMHRRKDLWGEDADEFRPERWDGRRSGWEYLPFNGGPRICIGQQFALTEAGYVIVRFLQRFEEMEGVTNSWDPVEKGGKGQIRQWLTLIANPADGVNIRMKEAKA